MCLLESCLTDPPEKSVPYNREKWKTETSNALTAITPSLLFSKHLEISRREERGETSVNYGFSFLEISEQPGALAGPTAL